MEGVHKRYAAGDTEVHALRGIDLKVAAGEFLAIMGPSGSGKSTLMNIIGCLDVADAGRYLLNGRDVTGMDSDTLARVRNEMVGFVFQGFNLLPRTSAMENVEIPLVYAGVERAERRRRSREILENVGLARREGHLPNQLSGGEQQRVAIARALVCDPSLVLADEPTGNLDTATSEEIMTLLVGLNRDAGVTLVLITHEPEVARHAGRVVTVRDGRLTA
ncbi:MAG: ABC transporter ATP-binding protein [Leptospirillia bacterium]